ncbi:MAG: glycosyltransferase family 2 protein [Planctomycetota bacterium]
MNPPKITIVTPSYQQSAFLERTIKSVLDQEYPNLEYLVFDGGSTDGSVDIIERYADRINHWQSEKDNGQSDAINKGLKRAAGDIIGWLNSDDTMTPGSLDRIARAYVDHPDVDLVYGHTCHINADDRIIRRLVALPTDDDELIHRNRNVFAQPGTTWRKSLQDRIGLLDESLHYTMDCDFWIRAAKAGKLLAIPHHLANLRVHGETKSTGFVERFTAEQEKLDERYGKEDRSRPAKRRYRIRRMFRLATNPRAIAFRLGQE